MGYTDGRGTDDALNTVTHLILKHLENTSSYARLLFMDLSSAFNTLLPQILLNRLMEMKVNHYMSHSTKTVRFAVPLTASAVFYCLSHQKLFGKAFYIN